MNSFVKPKKSITNLNLNIVDVANNYVTNSNKKIDVAKDNIKNHLITSIKKERELSEKVLNLLPDAFDCLSKLGVRKEINFSIPFDINIMSYNEQELFIEYEQLMINRIDFSNYNWDPKSLKVFYVDEYWGQQVDALSKLTNNITATSAVLFVTNIINVVDFVKNRVKKNLSTLNESSITYEPFPIY